MNYNKLYIIGNGFDLAHGLKTSYSDFFKWLWKKELNNAKIVIVPPIVTENGCEQREYSKIITSLFECKLGSIKSYCPGQEIITLLISQEVWCSQFSYDTFTFFTTFETNNLFLKELIILKQKNRDWADMEKIFFNILIRYAEIGHNNITKFNTDFELIKNLFETFLNDTVKISENTKNKKIEKLFYPGLTNTAFGKMLLEPHIDKYILNFNYTKTASIYSKNILSSVRVNHIHGELHSLNNPIIFGYGDERGEEYKKIELLDNNDYFEHIKSFAYLNTPNYSELLKYIDSKEFDVVIIGHSCGLTDRTLLNTIFEHPNCMTIKPIYYIKSSGEDNYQDMVRNISRSFDNKNKMRKMIINKKDTESIN